MKRLTAKFLIVLLITLSFGMFFMGTESNAAAVDELTIKIGYFGWQPSEYVEKAVFSASDLYEMGAYTEDYTYWDGSKRVAIDSSYGVPLSTIIDAAGIDQSSIQNLDFWTSDSGNGAFTSFTWRQLIGTKRYYFDDLAACFYYDDDENIVCDTDEAWNGAVRVQPMMALEESWVWYEIGTHGATGSENLGTANRFRLNFGQDSPTERRTFNSAKMVHTIYIMFSGAPQLTSDESNIKAKVGSSHQLKVTAAAVDEALEDYVQSGVVWSSSDTSIADVDSEGNLTFKKKGTVTIYASSGGATKEFVIVVGDEEDDNPEEQNTQNETKPDKKSDKKPEKKQDKGGTGSGKGKEKGNGSGNGTSGGSNTNRNGTNTRANTQKKNEKVKIEKHKSGTFVLSDEASRNLRSALNRQAPSEVASMSTHQKEMDKDAEQLKVKKDDNGLGGATGIMGGIIAIEGSLFGFISFRKQRWGYLWKVR